MRLRGSLLFSSSSMNQTIHWSLPPERHIPVLHRNHGPDTLHRNSRQPVPRFLQPFPRGPHLQNTLPHPVSDRSEDSAPLPVPYGLWYSENIPYISMHTYMHRGYCSA